VLRLIPGAASLLAAFALAFAGYAGATVPEGPRVAFTKWGPNPHSITLMSTGADGSGVRRLAGGTKPAASHGPLPFDGPTWSPDGSRIAYSGYFRSDKWEIFTAAPDGSDLRAVPHTVGARDPVFAPDGHTIAFSRLRIREPHIDIHHPLHSLGGGYESTTAWTVDLETGEVRRLTPWRNGLDNSPSSFSPDGSTLALSRNDPRRHDAVALQLATGTVSVLAHNAEDPVFLPDGTRVAFVSYRDRNHAEGFDGPVLVSELYVEELDGSGLQRITQTQELQEAAPSWDPSGERVAYTQTTANEPLSLGLTNVVMEVNVDGTCAKRIFGHPTKAKYGGSVGLYGPVWQPAPGREAGRIAC
jgi:Tol biopolymer transport system component